MVKHILFQKLEIILSRLLQKSPGVPGNSIGFINGKSTWLGIGLTSHKIFNLYPSGS